MTTLSQLVAVVTAVKTSVNKETAPLFHAAKNSALFAGLSKTYEPIEEGGEQLPPESVRVQRTVPEVLDAFRKPAQRLIDVIATTETANMQATASVIVEGITVIPEVPVVFLLQLEKFLEQEVRGILTNLPVLDPAQDWLVSGVDRKGIYETETIKRHRPKKVQRPIVLYDATTQHPAQTQLISEDVLVGYWNEKRYSGAIPASRKQDMISRLDKLIEAVKFAREKANTAEVTDVKVGGDILAYVLST